MCVLTAVRHKDALVLSAGFELRGISERQCHQKKDKNKIPKPLSSSKAATGELRELILFFAAFEVVHVGAE